MRRVEPSCVHETLVKHDGELVFASDHSRRGRFHSAVVIHARSAVLSIITGGGKWVELTIHADPLYHLLLTAERKFWRCIENGETPRLVGIETPRPRTLF